MNADQDRFDSGAPFIREEPEPFDEFTGPAPDDAIRSPLYDCPNRTRISTPWPVDVGQIGRNDGTLIVCSIFAICGGLIGFVAGAVLL